MLNPIKVIYNLPIDIYYYFKHKKYNDCVIGVIVAIIGLFGKGKTLTAVHIIVGLYLKKDGKKVWCKRRKMMVTQRVKIISNVELKVPFERFINLEQIVYSAKNNYIADDLNDTLTVTLVLGDEFSTQLNSRNFKGNINANLLNTILTCRHYYIALYYTTQRFGLVDALLRQVTSYCISCNKSWRLQGVDYFDAWEMENATSVSMIKPYRRNCWFVINKDYDAYDTLANVETLQKSAQNGDMMTDAEILALQCNNPNMDNVLNPSKKYRKIRKKMN
jgi:hypothetical protein